MIVCKGKTPLGRKLIVEILPLIPGVDPEDQLNVAITVKDDENHTEERYVGELSRVFSNSSETIPVA